MDRRIICRDQMAQDGLVQTGKTARTFGPEYEAAPCFLDSQDTFCTIVESIEVHARVVTPHAIAAGIIGRMPRDSASDARI
jgi:hypothetical protein